MNKSSKGSPWNIPNIGKYSKVNLYTITQQHDRKVVELRVPMSAFEVKPVLQPLELPSDSDLWSSAPRLAAMAWVRGPPKPRHVEREKETPPEEVDLASLAKKGEVVLKSSVKVFSSEDITRMTTLLTDVDAIVLKANTRYDESLLSHLINLGKPILPEWDRWGYAWYGRYLLGKLRRLGSSTFVPAGADDVKALIGALRAVKFLRCMRTLYVGDIPPHGIFDVNYDFDLIMRKFGTTFIRIDFEDYIREINEASDEDARKLANLWKGQCKILDGREEKLDFYAKVYIGIKSLLERYTANAITIDCAWLPDPEYVPCTAFSLLIDEGIPAGCEGDINQLIMMAALMAISRQAVLMGNLNENATHQDIENGIIVINHDVLPFSMRCKGCPIVLRDFHALGKGLTPYAELEKGALVTIAGLDEGMERIWATTGRVAWTKDTTHCRVAIGIKVSNAKRIMSEAFGHHPVVTYGDHIRPLQVFAKLLGLDFIHM